MEFGGYTPDDDGAGGGKEVRRSVADSLERKQTHGRMLAVD